MYVLDTNVISELRPGKPHQSPEVRAWAARQTEDQLFLSSIGLLEVEQGVLRLERRTPSQGSALRLWLDFIRRSFEGRILPFTDAAAVLCARMHVPDPQPMRDSIMAATALSYGFTIVTRNVQDFEDTGVNILNPWDPTEVGAGPR